MKGPKVQISCIRSRIAQDANGRFISGAEHTVALRELIGGTSLGGSLSQLAGRSVLLAVTDQFSAALAMIELDGVASRLILWPPESPIEHLPTVLSKGAVDAVVTDHDLAPLSADGIPFQVRASAAITPSANGHLDTQATEWVLLTSGTTGVPKLVGHDLMSLTSAIVNSGEPEAGAVWGTFYDIRRYGGLQIFLRALLGRASLVLSCAGEPVADHLLRLAAHSVTHLTGTPSHWRRALMSPAARTIAPRYVRLSGEIADKTILNSLRAFYPNAAVAHAYASTEAGVGFAVNDGLEGFPREFIASDGDVQIKVEAGSLLIRSRGTAAHYIGEKLALKDAEGFVDTGDMVELRGDRYHFLGRRSGMINVGGLKVHPEEVEAALNRHRAVGMCCVRSRRSPITGSVVVADVVLKTDENHSNEQTVEVKHHILNYCRGMLSRHMVPAALNIVSSLSVSSTGKISRHNE